MDPKHDIRNHPEWKRLERERDQFRSALEQIADHLIHGYTSQTEIAKQALNPGNAARIEALAREIKTPPVAPRARFG